MADPLDDLRRFLEMDTRMGGAPPQRRQLSGFSSQNPLLQQNDLLGNPPPPIAPDAQPAMNPLLIQNDRLGPDMRGVPPTLPVSPANPAAPAPVAPAPAPAAPQFLGGPGTLTGGFRGGIGPPVLPLRGGDGAAPTVNAAPPYSVVTNPGMAPRQEITSAPSLTISNGPSTQMFNPEGRQVGGGSFGGMVGTPTNPFNAATQSPASPTDPMAVFRSLQDQARQEAGVDFNAPSWERDAQLARRDQVMQRLLGTGQSIIQGNLGQGDLGLRATELLGSPGTRGRLQIAGQEADTHAQENERYGPAARYDSFYSQAYGAFPPGTPHDARVRQLQQQGMPPPQFLTGRPAPGQPAGQATGHAQALPPTSGVRDMYGIANPAAPQPSPVGGQNAIDSAFEIGTSAFPRDPVTGRRSLPTNPQAAHDAITRVFGAMDNDTIRQNFPAIQQRLLQEVGGADVLDQWINSSNLGDTMFGRQSPQTAQVNRILQLANMQRTPTVPGAPNNSAVENAGAYLRTWFPNMVSDWRR